MPTLEEKTVIRDLAKQVAEIAALPVQEEKRHLWRKLNGLRPERPMVIVDQVCWHEMGAEGHADELALRCEDATCRRYETRLRRTLFQWQHFPVDMVVEPYFSVPKAIHNTRFGFDVQEENVATDPHNSVRGHEYHNQFERDEDLEKIKTPVITHDADETERRLAFARELFDGVLEVKPEGAVFWPSCWDPISTWMSVEEALYALIDRPDFMHALVGRMVEGYAATLDQLEAQGLLCQPQTTIHCTGAYTDELPNEGYDPNKPRTQDVWTAGLAQMFSTVSPAMFKEYEVEYISPLCERFGLVYYGCCDPLDGKMDEVRQIPNVRKISMSPWANQEHGAEQIAGDFVFSRKPNPAFFAGDEWDQDTIRRDLQATRDIAARFGCPLELIQKDISTVRYQPHRLFEWAEVAMEVVQA